MKWELNCSHDRGNCEHWDNGYCLKKINKKGKPSKISQMKKCPDGTIKDVVK